MKDEMAGTWRVCPHEIALLLDAARKGVLEEAAKVCADRSAWATTKITTDDSVFGTYGNACDDCEELILALIDKPPAGG